MRKLCNHSTIEIYDDHVVKRDRIFQAWGCSYREAYWLTEMRDSMVTPRLYRHRPGALWMENVGAPATKETLPRDWPQQVAHILDELTIHGCSHNDITPGNLLVKGDWMYLIDFGWSTVLGEPIPQEWPSTIGSSCRLGDHVFDDGHSMEKAMEIIREG